MIVGDEGFVITLDVELDLSATQTMSLLLTRPDGTTVTRSLATGDLDVPGKHVYYRVLAGDLNQPGVYNVTVSDTTSGMKLSADPGEFYVRRPAS